MKTTPHTERAQNNASSDPKNVADLFDQYAGAVYGYLLRLSGARVAFAPNITVIGQGASRSIRSKALDDRIGVANLIEMVKNLPSDVELLAAFTV